MYPCTIKLMQYYIKRLGCVFSQNIEHNEIKEYIHVLKVIKKVDGFHF